MCWLSAGGQDVLMWGGNVLCGVVHQNERRDVKCYISVVDPVGKGVGRIS